MIEFARSGRRIGHLPLTALIDVVFILIVFFMLTTNFMKVESMELLMPSAAKSAKKTAVTDNLARVVLRNDGGILFGQRATDRDDLSRTLRSLFAQRPEQRVMLMSEDTVSLQTLVEVMDIVYLAGGKNVFVKAAHTPKPPEPAADITETAP